MTTRVLVLTAALWAAFAKAPAPGAAFLEIPEHPRGYVSYRASSPVTIDGSLTDAAWRDAPWTGDFVDIEGTKRAAPAHRTRVKMLWDDTYFYIGADLVEPALWATMKERDSVIFQENDFEFFIDPDGDNHEYYEFEINALGTGWDLLLPRPYRDGGTAVDGWDIRGLKSAIHLDGTLNVPGDIDRGWSIELAVPWAALGKRGIRPPADGDQWRVNFSRVQWPLTVIDGAYKRIAGRSENNWVWSPQHVVDMHRPEMWGYVQFSAARPGTTTFRPDAALPARQWLHAVYYAQREFRKKNGRFAAALAELGVAPAGAPSGAPPAAPPAAHLRQGYGGQADTAILQAPMLAVTGSLFEATIDLRLPGGKVERWHIRQDSLIWSGQ